MTAPNLGNVLVLVGDAQHARIVRAPAAGDALDVGWESYAKTPDLRSLDQAPAIDRRSSDAREVSGETNAQFAHDVAMYVRRLVDERPGMRLVVIAPHSFANALKGRLGDAWPTGVGDFIARDETKLDDEVLRFFVIGNLNAYP